MCPCLLVMKAFLFICLPGPSLLVPCSISIHLSFRSVTGGVRPCPLARKHFYSFVSQVRYCWCPPFSAGNAAFLFICLPGLSLLVSALFRRPCSISIHQSPRSVTVGVRPFPLATEQFYSFVFQVWCPPFSAGHAAFLFICFPCDFFLFVLQVWCLHCCFLPCPLEQVHL